VAELTIDLIMKARERLLADSGPPPWPGCFYCGEPVCNEWHPMLCAACVEKRGLENFLERKRA